MIIIIVFFIYMIDFIQLCQCRCFPASNSCFYLNPVFLWFFFLIKKKYDVHVVCRVLNQILTIKKIIFMFPTNSYSNSYSLSFVQSPLVFQLLHFQERFFCSRRSSYHSCHLVATMSTVKLDDTFLLSDWKFHIAIKSVDLWPWFDVLLIWKMAPI